MPATRDPRRLLLRLGLLGLLGAAAGAGVALLTPVAYTAEARSAVMSADAPGQAHLLAPAPGGWTPSLAETYAGVAADPIVLGPVIRRLHLHTTAARLGTAVHAEADPGSPTVRIAAVDPSPVRAAAIANAVQDQLAASVRSITPRGGEEPPVRVSVIERARPPAAPSAPDLGLDVVLGALAGALAGGLALGGTAAVRALRRPPARDRAPSMF
jgi:polysaccharide biosynthesis transport protein